MLGAILLQLILIFFNAIFACAEIAVISMNDAKLKHLSQEGDRRAKRLVSLTDQPAKFLSTIQVAITLAGLLGGAFAAENFAGPLVNLIASAGVPIPRNVLHSILVILIMLVLTYFQIVFGELVPKRLAMKKTESLSLALSGLLYLVAKICAPLVWLLTASTNGILRLLKIDPNEEDEVVTEEEIRMMLAEGKQQGTIQLEENQMIQNVFEFDDTSADQVSTHRREITFLWLEDDDDEWAKTIQESRFTYYPICDKDQDDIVGILDTKNYFRSDDKSRAYVMQHAVDEPFFIPESMKANVLFSKMKQTRNYFAVVLDEYGCTSGIVTLHDLMEALVGDLEEDETLPRHEDIEKLADNLWRIEGYADLKDVAETLAVALPDTTYDTFNGFVWDKIDRVPSDGESFTVEACCLEIDVKSVKNHMIEYAVVKKLQQEESDAQQASVAQ